MNRNGIMKIKINFYIITSLILCATACKDSTGTKTGETENKKPNIVLIFTDDQTYESVAALGNYEIHTPNIDRLVDGGTTFTHAYNMGGWNGAICVASRSMIISGSYIWNAKEKDSSWRKNDSLALQQTWPRLMEGQGYKTYMTGKWHVQAPADVIFNNAEHIRPGMPRDRGREVGVAYKKWKTESGDMKDWNDYMPVGYGRPLNEEDTEWAPTDTLQGGFWEGGKHWSEVVRDDALSFIKDTERHEDPYFMYLAFNAPHDPRQAPQRFLDMYPLDSIAVPESFLPEYPYKDDMGNPPVLRDEALAPYPRTEYAVKKHRQEYYASITHLDEQIGKILDALEATGDMENTYIFFTADHGLSVGQHGLIGKQSMFDHSVRVPFVVNGPNVAPGKKIGTEIYLQDVMATSLELAGIEKPDYVQFNSLLDVMEGTSNGHYDAIYGAYMNVQRMIRKDGFKLIIYPKIDKLLLFDLEKDSEEINNLADKPEYADKVKGMFGDLLELQDTMNDELELGPLFDKRYADKN